MNRFAFTTVVAVATLSSAAALTQPTADDMKDMAMKPAASSPLTTVHHATGVVKKVDAKVGLVTLAHEPVKTMNWPAMTMGFMVKDKILFEKLAVGEKVDFDFVQDSKGYVVTAVK